MLAVMFLDLDDFKMINDTMGNDVGDQLLVEVSERLVNTLRKCDTVSRIGGDEFIILIEVSGLITHSHPGYVGSLGEFNLDLTYIIHFYKWTVI
ncbi:diguanylate cyclase [Clostridium sp.]|uniref:diguanylate cyclase domain-containing protein n=1 Tax=Clostridium sp. TaxID=1506 RepID=UPI0025BBCDD6|nr:GGDEF domain-containing protein [Clostridium sp.]